MTLPSGAQFGRYKLESLLGAGGMGEVYLAQDTQLGRRVALKVLPAALVTDRDRLRRFQQEAYAASALNHPNIITIHEIGSCDSVPFIVTEFVDGESLRRRMSQDRLPLRDILDVAIQISSALSAAHEAGIVHRDIKPENLMLRHDGFLKVLDFGLAKLSDQNRVPSTDPEAATLVQTEAGVVMGTATYMSPEQARGKKVDARTDIWSSGVVIYEMVAGRIPFDGSTPSDQIAEILKAEPPSLAQHAPDLPAELQRIVRKALRKDADERYQTAREMAVDLKTLRRELEVSAGSRRAFPSAQSARHEAFEDGAGVAGTHSDALTKAIPQVPAQTDRVGGVRQTLDHTSNGIKARRKTAAFALAALIIAASLGGFWLYKHRGENRGADTAQTRDMTTSSGPSPPKLYTSMTKAEQMRFVEQQAERIGTMLGSNPPTINFKALGIISADVDHLAARVNNGKGDVPWEGNLVFVFRRAQSYAPAIIKAFNQRKVPPVVGLYVPVVESEFQNFCTPNSVGAMGLYQFIPATGKLYGLTVQDLCDARKETEAAARYMADQILDWGSDSTSVSLALLSYNRAPDAVRRDLHKILGGTNRERSVWTLVAEEDKLDEQFRNESVRYVPWFFAAAIVGENPQAFGLDMQPLSTYTDERK